MFVETMIGLVLDYWPIVLTAAIVSRLISNKYRHGLHRYPGPTLAAYTDWWRFFEVLWTRETERTYITLHEKYGDVVRVGPNVLSFADPRAIKTIYGLNKGMTKSDFYPVQQAVAKGRRLQSLFSTKDEEYHARYRRCVNNAFAMSSLVGYEPLVDRTTDVFIEQTERRYCQTGCACDFARWLQFFAFDVIGELTWSKRLGFVERDEDVDGIVKFIGDFLAYAGPVGQMPWLDLLWEKNPVRLQFQRWGISKTVFPVTKFAIAQSADRAAEMDKIRQDGQVGQASGQAVDLLMKFTQAQHDHPSFMTDAQVLSSCTSMIFAGSETTAISLSSIFYHLAKHPQAYATLMQELDGADIPTRPHHKLSWAESQRLPYLDAVIQESFRLHPAAGLLLERVVPAQGIEILGHMIPGGTIVGCNAWVLHRRAEIFGADVNIFRPERWLQQCSETPEEFQRRLREMKATMFQFGAGARTCIGKNISLLEIYKLVPTFLRNFEVALTCPDTKWSTYNAWFVRQRNFHVTFTRRDGSEKA